MGKRYSVLTYIIGSYEIVHEISEKDDDAEYILVTDNPNLKSETWDVIYEEKGKRTDFDMVLDIRFHPFRYVNTPIVVRIDGSIGILKSLKPIIDKFEEGVYDRCLMIHPERNRVQQEYNAWIAFRGYPQEQAIRCMKLMRIFGYDPNKKGLIQACFEIVMDKSINTLINDLSFGFNMIIGSEGKMERLDQTITSFVLQKYF